MRVVWENAHKKCNITGSSFADIVENSDTTLTQDDKDFILTSYNAGMYNYVVEYVYNKAKKILGDAIFAIDEDIVINITHWIDKSFISKFFDVFILRLATDFDLISRQEKLSILQTIEFLQKRKDSESNSGEIDKDFAKQLIINLFDAVLTKDFDPFVNSITEVIETLYTCEILPYSDYYNEIIQSSNRYKNLLIRIMSSMLKCTNVDAKRYKTLCQNVKNLFPFLWENATLNDKKFLAYFLKVSPQDSAICKLFEELENQIKLQDFNTDINAVTKILKSCQDILSSHYSINNHKGEIAPIIQLGEVDHFPNLFLRSVITPCLVTYLGNSNGYFNESRVASYKVLEKITQEKWTYYFKNYFAKDDFVLSNLILVDCCLKDWCNLVKKMQVDQEDIANENIRELLIASKGQNFEKIKEFASKIYYS